MVDEAHLRGSEMRKPNKTLRQAGKNVQGARRRGAKLGEDPFYGKSATAARRQGVKSVDASRRLAVKRSVGNARKQRKAK